MQVSGDIWWSCDPTVAKQIMYAVFNGVSISDEGGLDGPNRALLGLMLAQCTHIHGP